MIILWKVIRKKKKKYLFYRSEWYRRAKQFDYGKAPLAVTCELVSTCNLGCSMCYTITEEFQDSVVGATRMEYSKKSNII